MDNCYDLEILPISLKASFPKDEVVQHITIEDSVDKIINNDEAIYETLLKEFLIKDDIINSKKYR